MQIGGDNAGGVNIAAPDTPTQSLNQLPRDLPGFIGRSAPRAELSALLSAPGEATPTVVTVSGMAGVGKTAFATHVGHLLVERFPDACLHANLHGYEPDRRVRPASALSRFLRDLGMPGEQISTDVERRAAQYRSSLANKRVLILLDNVAAADQVRPLLPGSSSSLVLITSRHSLRSLIAADGAYHIELSLFSTEEAVRLLARGAGTDRLTREPRAAEHLAELSGYLPLAVGVVTGILATHPSWPLRHMVDLLAKERESLAASGASAATGEDVALSEVRAGFALSYQCLDPPVARMFRMLALAPGADFTRGAAAALTGTGGDDAARLLYRLVDVHLITESATPGVYRCHELLRRYARRQAHIDESKRSRRAARRRLLQWYADTAYAADRLIKPGRRQLGAREPHRRSTGADVENPASRERRRTGGEANYSPARTDRWPTPFTDPATAMDWLEQELPNLVSATHLAVDHGFDQLAWRIPEALGSFLNIRKHWANWQEISELGLGAARRLRERPAEGSMLNLLGLIHKDLRAYDQATHYLEESRAVWKETKDSYGTAQVLLNLGSVRAMRHDVQQARYYLDDGLRLSRTHGHRYLEARFLHNLGCLQFTLGDTGSAIARLEKSLEVCRDIEDPHGECDTLGELGQLHRALGRFGRAVYYTQESLAISWRIGAPLDRANAFTNLGQIFVELGETADAIDSLRRSLEIRRTIGDRYGEGRTLEELGDAFARTGEDEQAESLWRLAREVLAESGGLPG